MKLTDLRGILQYIPQFREKTFVIAIDGAIVTDENFATLLLDVAVLRSLSIRVVLVHGASAQIQALADEQKVSASDLDGAGITDANTLKLALNAANRLTHEILEGLSANDIRAASTNVIIAHPMGIIGGVDHLFTGKVERVDTALLQTLLAQDVIPVIPPLGFDGDGKTYRVNSDGVAVAVAEALKAIKLIFITAQDGLRYNQQLIRQMLVSELQNLLQQNSPGFVPEILSKAQHAAQACKSGVPRVHIINGKVDEGLLAEVFSNEGIGTLIYADEYQAIRKAMRKDIRHIMALIKPSIQGEQLVKRTRSSIDKHVNEYYVFEIDNNIVGLIALHSQPDSKYLELASLAVNPAHEHRGIGTKLALFVENLAREQGVERIFCLSTQAFTFFQHNLGYSEGTPDDLPPARREKYEQSGRNSKVLIKNLAPLLAPAGLPPREPALTPTTS